MSIAIRVFGAFISFLSVAMIANALGAEGAGPYFYFLAIATLASVIGRLGFDGPLVRYVAVASEDEKRAILSFAVSRVMLFVPMISLFSFLLVCFFEKSNFFDELIVLAAAVVCPLLIAVTNLVCLALGANRKMEISQFILNCAFPLAMIFVVQLFEELSAHNLVFITFLIWSLLLGFSVYFWISTTKQSTVVFIDKRLFKSALALWPGTIMSAAVAWVGQIALGIYSRPDAVSAMAVIQKIYNAISLVTVATNVVSAPDISRLYANLDRRGIISVIRKNRIISISFMLPLVVFICVFSNEILSYMGVTADGSDSALIFVSILCLMSSSLGIYGYVLIMSGNERQQARSILYAFLFFSALSIVLIPGGGLLGACISFSLGMLVERLASFHYARLVISGGG